MINPGRTADQLQLRECLDGIYRAYNRRDLIHPDPLEFVWRYRTAADREIAGLVASGLAYGRVAQILKSTDRVLTLLGTSPSETLANTYRDELDLMLSGFKHRFTTSDEVAALLSSAASVQKEWGLMGNLLKHLAEGEDFGAALDRFVGLLLRRAGLDRCSLLPIPGLGSACKRLHLFLRWMVRRDEVDPGCWEGIPPAVLTVPLDVHMFRLSKAMGLTERKSADCRAASEITEGFRALNPDDPVKYDFALTRMGIQGREDDALFREFRSNHCPFIDSRP